jgi:Copper chaperone
VSAVVHTFRIEGMHCAGCALLIDDTLEDLPGVASTQTSMKLGRAVVELGPGSTPAELIAAVIYAVDELGYTTHHES